MPDRDVFIHESSYVDDDVRIGEKTRIWHFCHIQSGSRIGRNCSLGQNVNIGNNVSVGDFVKIQNNVSIYEGVTLEDYVFCGPSMVFTNISVPRSEFPQRGSDFYTPTRVKKGASLGANATIVCGTVIGCYAFVAAGSTVTRDVPDFALVMGVPARRTGWVCRCGERLVFQKQAGGEERSVCARCGRRYRQRDERVSEEG